MNTRWSTSLGTLVSLSAITIAITACAVGSEAESEPQPADAEDPATGSSSTTGSSTSSTSTGSGGADPSTSGAGGAAAGGSPGSGGAGGMGAGGGSAMCISELSTGNTTQGGWDGQMFDVAATNEVVVTAMGLNLFAGTHDVEIYVTTHTFLGYQDIAGAWTQVANAAAIGSSGPGTPVTIAFSAAVTIPAGTQYGFYVTTVGTDGFGLEYSGATSIGDVAASNADVKILDGVGSNYPFNGMVGDGAPRRWHGNLVYETTCTP